MDNRIQIIQGDITNLDTDAIVNAANSSLMGGGGVDGAIHAVGGPSILEECMLIVKKRGPLETGGAVFTNPGELKCKFIIHTVGPVWQGGGFNERELLADAYGKSLELACKLDATTIAFPNVSTGIYGFPKTEAAEIAIATVSDFLNSNTSIKKVLFCCYDSENYNIYNDLMKDFE